MPQLIMDNAEVALSQGYSQLGDLLDAVNEQIPEGRIVSHIYLDDREVMEQHHDQLREQSLEAVSTIRIETVPLATQVGRSIADLLGFLKELRPVLRQSGRELRYGAVSNASTRLADCFEGMETAVRSIEQLVPVLPNLDAGLTDDELKYFSAKEGDLLRELANDFQRKDWLSLADRLEFQLDPLMGRWQTSLTRVLNTLQAKSAAQS